MNKYSLFSLYRRSNWFYNKHILRRSVIKRKLLDVEMYLDLITPGISKTLALYKTREDDMVQVLKELLRPGMTIIDCGSNIGFYPLLESKILKNKGEVYAIEPDVRNFKILEKNVRLNGGKSIIKTFNIAVSNKTGSQKMFVAEQSNLNKLLSSSSDNFPKRHNVDEIVDVETITMDDLLYAPEIMIWSYARRVINAPKLLINGLNPSIDNPDAILNPFCSAIPTSINLWGNALPKALVLVAPDKSQLTTTSLVLVLPISNNESPNACLGAICVIIWYFILYF